jgi:hypothetical protein
MYSYAHFMIGGLSLGGLMLGTVIAYMAGRYARHKDLLEAFGGVLLIAGLALLGYNLGSTFVLP